MFRLHRIASKPNYTIGKLYFDNIYLCDTLERESPTRINNGTYPLDFTYSPKFKKILPLLCNTDGHIGIRIHQGNSAKDTTGCILLGKNDKIGWLSNSQASCFLVFNLMDSLRKFTKLSITID